MKTPKPAPIERPCSTCSHLHEGIPCMETGCECKVSTVAEIQTPPSSLQAISAGGEPAGGNTEGGNTEPAAQTAEDSIPERSPDAMATYDADLQNFPGNPAVLFAGDATVQLRVGQLLECFEQLGEPVGCELTLYDDTKFKWTGADMVEVVAPPLAAPATAPTLSDEDVAKLREVVNAQNPAIELPDGSVMISIKVDADTLGILKGWAEGTNEQWEVVLQRTAEMGLGAVVHGASVAG